MTRFFVSPGDVSGDTVTLSGEDLDHIRALRIKSGEGFIACTGDGREFLCELVSAEKGSASARIVKETASQGEPRVRCTVFAAWAKGERLDFAVQKCTELGAHDIVLFPSKRCVARPDEKSAEKKIARLQKIAREAAQQSGRGIIPQVYAVRTFKEAAELASGSDVPIFCYEEEREKGIISALREKENVNCVSVMTGPEGGFEPSEVEEAKSLGLIPVSLGRRILRCETAPMFALTAVMLHTENL